MHLKSPADLFDVPRGSFCWRNNYGFDSRFQHAFTRLIEIAWSAPHHKRSQQKDKDGTRKCGRLHDHSGRDQARRSPRSQDDHQTKQRCREQDASAVSHSQNVMRHADQTFDGSHSATSIALGEPQTLTAPSRLATIAGANRSDFPCLLPEPLLDQTSDNAGSVRSKRRKRAAAMAKLFDAYLKGRRKAEFEEPKPPCQPVRNGIQ